MGPDEAGTTESTTTEKYSEIKRHSLILISNNTEVFVLKNWKF